MSSRRIKPEEKVSLARLGVTGFGAAVPVASNATDEGRSRNRRVEVWLR